ncbi:GFA family protein [Endozoicomonas sp. ALD040]|uniref:GFA family protein n=1 Tax=Endozoicomonas sp. ALD040 TaxID=3403079 RepID=UPI003BAF02C4
MIGQCLCNEVKFKLSCETPNFYQCHCSLCRKVTGSSANAGALISKEYFEWVQGQNNISSFVKDSGYRVDFCKSCGSPVPNPLSNTELVWVPVGLLEDPDGKVVIHLHTSSKAGWDVLPQGSCQHKTMPSLHELQSSLCKST